MQNVLETDGELSAAEITLETARAIEDGGPWGQAFPEPVFEGEFDVADVRVRRRPPPQAVAARGDAASQPVEAIAFGYFDEDGAKRPAAGAARHASPIRLQSTSFGGTPRAELLAEHVEWKRVLTLC